MSKKYFGTDGIRGCVGQAPITPDFMLKLGWAAGCVLGRQKGTVLIGKDTRISGYMFESALESGLSAAGVDVMLLGPMPTPGIAYLTRALNAQAGIVISASHNSYEDNGIKFFNPDGTKLDDKVELEIEAYCDKPLQCNSSAELGKVKRLVDAGGRYIEFCKSTIPSNLDFRGLKLVVDCANGATYNIAPQVFSERGAEVIPIAVDPDGLNINKGVGSTHLDALRAKVIACQADVGVALDGDGDRVIMVDANARIYDGDDIMYMIAKSRLRSGSFNGRVVGTQMTNLGVEQALKKLGIAMDRAQVGDRYVMEQLRSTSSVLGGESSGHIICLDRTTTGDGIVAALQVLAEMVQTNSTLADLTEGLSKFPQRMINVAVRDKKKVFSAPQIAKAVDDAEKKLGDAGRVLLRPSGTEPLVRVMVEGEDGKLINQLVEEIAAVVEAA